MREIARVVAHKKCAPKILQHPKPTRDSLEEVRPSAGESNVAVAHHSVLDTTITRVTDGYDQQNNVVSK